MAFAKLEVPRNIRKLGHTHCLTTAFDFQFTSRPIYTWTLYVAIVLLVYVINP